jgi:hypothetical protein
VRRVALNADQVAEYGLPEQPGKTATAAPRASLGTAACAGRAGRADPDVLHSLYEDAILDYWDVSTFEDTPPQRPSRKDCSNEGRTRNRT